MIPASTTMPRWHWADGRLAEGARELAEEAAIALVHDGATHAVMMATPADLPDFALGFSLAEGLVDSAADIEALDVVQHAHGIELRMYLSPRCAERPRRRLRTLAGPVGCGLCGLQSLAEVFPAVPSVGAGVDLPGHEVALAMAALLRGQRLNATVRATHAAGFWQPGRGLLALREDVGRHNALDKLAGSLAHAGCPGAAGAVVISSRVSIEMVQKAARLGASIIIAASAPTALAVRVAADCGITLIGTARGAGFEVFSIPHRILADPWPAHEEPRLTHSGAAHCH